MLDRERRSTRTRLEGREILRNFGKYGRGSVPLASVRATISRAGGGRLELARVEARGLERVRPVRLSRPCAAARTEAPSELDRARSGAARGLRWGAARVRRGDGRLDVAYIHLRK